MQLDEKLSSLLSPTAEHEGFDLVSVAMTGENKYRALEVLVDRLDGAPVTVADCENLSRQFGALLDVEDAVPGRYFLEVSSPGMDRPLTKPAHFKRFEGKDVKILLHRPLGERRRFTGILRTADELTVSVETAEKEIVPLEYSNIQSARLIPNEDDFRETLRKKKTETKKSKHSHTDQH